MQQNPWNGVPDALDQSGRTPVNPPYPPGQIPNPAPVWQDPWQQPANPYPPQSDAYGWQLPQGSIPPQGINPPQGTMPQQSGIPEPPPRQPRPKRTKSTPKQKRHGSRRSGWLIVLALVIVGGVGFFLWRNSNANKPNTAVIVSGRIGDYYVGDALIVRDETAYDEEGVQSIEYKAEEGSVCYSGNVICNVYSTGYNSKEMTTLQNYRDEIRDQQLTLVATETAYDQKMTRLEYDVVQRGLEVRSLVQGARSNFFNQELSLEMAINARQEYFRNKYSSNARLNRAYDSETTQLRRIESWLKPKICTMESIVSFYTDGFEFALTPSKYEAYTPAEVRSMIQGEKPAISSAARGRTTLYRLVKQNNYAILMLIRNSTWNPADGSIYSLEMQQFTNTLVDVRVRSTSRANGELLVRLDVMGDVRDVLYMRTCKAKIGEDVDCLVVPESALYQQNNSIGVVLSTQEGQLYVPVNILGRDGQKAYVTAIQTGLLTNGQVVQLFH